MEDEEGEEEKCTESAGGCAWRMRRERSVRRCATRGEGGEVAQGGQQSGSRVRSRVGSTRTERAVSFAGAGDDIVEKITTTGGLLTDPPTCRRGSRRQDKGPSDLSYLEKNKGSDGPSKREESDGMQRARQGEKKKTVKGESPSQRRNRHVEKERGRKKQRLQVSWGPRIGREPLLNRRPRIGWRPRVFQRRCVWQPPRSESAQSLASSGEAVVDPGPRGPRGSETPPRDTTRSRLREAVEHREGRGNNRKDESTGVKTKERDPRACRDARKVPGPSTQATEPGSAQRGVEHRERPERNDAAAIRQNARRVP